MADQVIERPLVRPTYAALHHKIAGVAAYRLGSYVTPSTATEVGQEIAEQVLPAAVRERLDAPAGIPPVEVVMPVLLGHDRRWNSTDCTCGWTASKDVSHTWHLASLVVAAVLDAAGIPVGGIHAGGVVVAGG